MRLQLLFFVVLSMYFSCFSQSSFGKKKKSEPVVLRINDFEKGMYSSFDDFLKAQPFSSGRKFDSLLFQIRDAVYCKSDISWRDASYDDKVPFYPCVRTEDDLRKMLLEKSKIGIDSVWGFNDGNFIYCKLSDNFYPLISLGRYAVINLYNDHKQTILNNPNYSKMEAEVNSTSLSSSMEFQKDIGYPFIYKDKMKLFLFSMETGNITKFTTATLEEILKKDDELYNEYLTVKHTAENNGLFLSKFNQKYPIEF